MKIVFLGTGGSNPSETRHTASIIIPELGVIFDAGTGFFRVRDFIRTREIHIFFSHYHLDHTCGLQYFPAVFWGKKINQIHLWGSQVASGVKQVFSEPIFPLNSISFFYKIQFHELSDQDINISQGGKNFNIKWLEMTHTSHGSVGFRLEYNGKSLVYITDTIVSGQYVSFAQNADVLICECTFRNGYKTLALKSKHSYSEIVGKFAQKAAAKKMYLYHLNPLDPQPDIVLQETKKFFPNTFLPEDKMEITI